MDSHNFPKCLKIEKNVIKSNFYKTIYKSEMTCIKIEEVKLIVPINTDRKFEIEKKHSTNTLFIRLKNLKTFTFISLNQSYLIFVLNTINVSYMIVRCAISLQ